MNKKPEIEQALRSESSEEILDYLTWAMRRKIRLLIVGCSYDPTLDTPFEQDDTKKVLEYLHYPETW